MGRFCITLIANTVGEIHFHVLQMFWKDFTKKSFFFCNQQLVLFVFQATMTSLKNSLLTEAEDEANLSHKTFPLLADIIGEAHLEPYHNVCSFGMPE